MPNIPRIGVSKKIEDRDERARLKNIVKTALPEGMGAIIRTTSESRQEHEIVKDINFLLETWQQMAYVRLNETAASQWFSPDGVREPHQPNQNTITNGIRRFGKNDPMVLNNLRAVEKEISNLNKGAHPTVLAVMQTDTPDPEQRQLGANFDPDLFRRTWSIGTVALALLLHETIQIVEVDADWWTEFGEIRAERSRLHEHASVGDA